MAMAPPLPCKRELGPLLPAAPGNKAASQLLTAGRQWSGPQVSDLSKFLTEMVCALLVTPLNRWLPRRSSCRAQPQAAACTACTCATWNRTKCGSYRGCGSPAEILLSLCPSTTPRSSERSGKL